MTPAHQVAQHPASVDAYIRHNWSLVPIPSGTKGPRTQGWNLKENALRSQTDLPDGYGIGLAHAYSGTMALDIDAWDKAAEVLSSTIDLNALYAAPDAVIVDSGRAGHGKLLYAMPTPLPSKKIIIGGETIYELRCATANGLTVQDILPPSIHPQTGQPYRWAGNGNWMRLPPIPEALLNLWQSMLTQDKERTIKSSDAINASWEEIQLALSHVPADCSREEWVSCGMAIRWAADQTNQPDQGLYIWNEWSKQSESKYPGEREILNQWGSFRSDKMTAVKLGTLFHIAKRHGFIRPPVDVSSLFSATEPSAPESEEIDMRPKPPTVDMSLVPPVLARRATEIGETRGCDPLIPLFAGMGAVCAAIDARCRLEIREDFEVPPILWLMTIGDPSDKKSPGSAPMFKILEQLEAEDSQRYAKDLLDWQGKEAAHASAMKAFLDFSASPESLLSTDQAPHVPELPPQPVPVRLTINDATSQKMVRLAAERPRGLLCALDEMGNWVKKMTDKSSAEDRSAWVQGYESRRYTMDRVGSGNIIAENMAIAIYGNIQPRVYKESLNALSTDGLLQRFIPAILNGGATVKPKMIPKFLQNTQQWEQSIRIIYSLPISTYRLSPEAASEFDAFEDWYYTRRDDERILNSDGTFMTAFGKLEGLVGRLALIWHVIEAPFNPQVSGILMRRVVTFVKSYVVPAYKYALVEMSGISTFDQWVKDYVMQMAGEEETITLTALKRSARAQIGNLSAHQQDQQVYGAMFPLEQGKWVVRIDDGSQEHRHVAVWAIDPALAKKYARHRRAIIEAKKRTTDYIYRDSKKGYRHPIKGEKSAYENAPD